MGKCEMCGRGETNESWLKSYFLDGDSVILFRKDDGKSVTYKVVSVIDGQTVTGKYKTSRSAGVDTYDTIIDVIRERH